jgi:hypothetical protein
VHPPLGEARLGPRAFKVVGPQSTLAMRELAARALVPLIGAETWLALYHLWAAGDEPHAGIAGRTAAELPGPPIFAALADPLVPPPALDFMARRRLTRADELAVLVRHPMVADATLELVARCGPARVCEVLAAAHRRLLACPTIAAALACNPHCPPSALHAAVEFGARERVPGLRGLQQALLAGHVRPDSKADHAARVDAALRSLPGDLFPAPPLPPDPEDAPEPPAPPAPEPVSAAPPPAPARAGVDIVLDPKTPLPVAMSLLSRLRTPDLRRVVQARRLPPVLVAAARRRLGA